MTQTDRCRQMHSEILRLRDLGWKLKDVAPKIGVNRGLLVYYCSTNGILFRQKTAEEWDRIDLEIRQMADSGMTREQIEAEMQDRCGSIDRRLGLMGLRTGRTGPRSGKDHPEWKGGRVMDKHGYVEIFVPMHPLSKKDGRVFEHRLLTEIVLNRYLTRIEVVHHKDDHPRHNWPENLELFACNADHLRHELIGRYGDSHRWLIPNGYGSRRKLIRCPSESETLALCPSEIRQRLAWYIESHRPTNAHRMLNRQQLRELGAWREVFQ